MGQQYSYSSKWGRGVVFHIYGDEAIFLLFYDDQDTTYE